MCRNTRQVTFVDWDCNLLRKHSDAVDDIVSGLSGDKCWHTIFGQSLFAGLIHNILQYPADLVMLQLKRHER